MNAVAYWACRGGVALRERSSGRQQCPATRPTGTPVRSETFDCCSPTVERPPDMLLASSPDRSDFVDIDVTAAAWIGLIALIVVMLAIDLYKHREAHAPTTREALVESSIWIACGLSFGAVIFWAYGSAAFGEYISGYLIEKSLSVDNVFVWSILFT